jgi:transcriptional regulator with XRE-family HTH domain
MTTMTLIGNAVHARREEVGLSKARLARLSKLSRQTVHDLEKGSLKDLSFNRLSNLLNVLGMSFDSPSLTGRQRKKGLWMAAKSSSVSYYTELTSNDLQQALSTGKVPAGLAANLLHFLDETPIQLVVMAVEETAQQASVKPQKVWKNAAILAKTLGASRNELWV